MSRLSAQAGPLEGRLVEVDRELFVGREAADVTIEDGALSRRHAVLRPAPDGGVQVEDLGSSNGTVVDGRRITGPVVAAPGSVITMGATVFRVEPAAAPAQAVPVRPANGGQAPQTMAVPPPARQASPSAAPAAALGSSAPVTQKSTSKAPLVLVSIVAVAALVAVVALLATRDSGSSSSGGKGGNQALKAAAGNVAFLSSEVSPRLTTTATSCVPATDQASGPGHFLFLTGGCENSTATVATLTLHKGMSNGHTVYYVIMDDSDPTDAKRLGVNYVPKLKNGIGSDAVQKVTMDSSGTLTFPGTVDFNHKRVLVGGPQGFPPSKFSPSAVGDAKYSPLIELPNGIVLNAPQVANDTGKAIKVVKLDTKGMKVEYVETEGRYESKHVHYASFDSTSALAATIEQMTYAPGLASVPGQGSEDLKTSTREMLMAFVNGPTGPNQPARQGINSTILDDLDPHNLLHETPELPNHPDVGDIAYSPMWDVHLVQWTAAAVASGDRTEMRGIGEVAERLSKGPLACEIDTATCNSGLIQAIGGKPVTEENVDLAGAAGFVVNCPLISIDLP